MFPEHNVIVCGYFVEKHLFFGVLKMKIDNNSESSLNFVELDLQKKVLHAYQATVEHVWQFKRIKAMFDIPSYNKHKCFIITLPKTVKQ